MTTLSKSHYYQKEEVSYNMRKQVERKVQCGSHGPRGTDVKIPKFSAITQIVISTFARYHRYAMR